MTTSKASRATVLRFCECLSQRDFAGMAARVTDDATWWVVGRPEQVSYAGLHPFKDVIKVIDSFLGSLDAFSYTVENSIAEGERVVVEAVSAGRKGTAHYQNTYLKRFQLRDGKVQSIREFLDPFEISSFMEKLGSLSA